MQPEPDARKATSLRASVSAIIRNAAGEVLLQRRSDNGQWGLPGGAIEIGESAAAAICREVREETGLEVEPLKLVGVYSDPAFQVVRYADGNVVHYVSLFFACRPVSGQLCTSEETLELGYFDPRALPESVLPMHRIRVQDALADRPAAFVR
ncbi:MAG: NUDIX domain-containing protein [Candidatus Methylomirabilales bacterium]